MEFSNGLTAWWSVHDLEQVNEEEKRVAQQVEIAGATEEQQGGPSGGTLRVVYVAHVEGHGYTTPGKWSQAYTQSPMAARFYGRRCDATTSGRHWAYRHRRAAPTPAGQRMKYTLPKVTVTEIHLRGLLKQVSVKYVEI